MFKKKGAVIVEFALVIPIFISLLFFTIEILHILFIRQHALNIAHKNLVQIQQDNLDVISNNIYDELAIHKIQKNDITLNIKKGICSLDKPKDSIKLIIPVNKISITGNFFGNVFQDRTINVDLYAYSTC